MNVLTRIRAALPSIGDAEAWINDTDPGTWCGHWSQGLAYYELGFHAVRGMGAPEDAAHLAGMLNVTCCFLPREIGNLWAYARKHGWAAAIRNKGLDGWMDFGSPYMALGTGVLGVTGGPQSFLAGLLASAIVIVGVAFATRKSRK